MKRIVYLLLAFLYTLNNVLAYSPTCSTVGSLPYGASWTAPNKVLGTQVLGNDNILLTPIDTICGTDLPLLPGKADAETITGVWTFSSAPAFSSGGPPTSSNECDATGELCPYESVVRDSGNQTITGVKTFSSQPILSVECSGTGEACPYESVVRDTGTQTIAGVKTFSSAPISSAAASGSTELARWGEVSTAISAVTAGGCSISSSAPVAACTDGACHHRQVNGGIVTYVCTSSGNWVESNADAVSKAVAYTGAVTISSSGSLTIPTPTLTTHATTKAYVDSNAGAGPTFTNSLVLWLDAATVTGIASASAVTTWKERSINLNHPTQGTAGNRPTFRSSIVNSLPVIRFDGSNDVLTTPAVATDTTKPLTVYIVASTADVSGGGGGNQGIIGTGSGANQESIQFTTTGHIGYNSPGSVLYSYAHGISANTFAYYTITINGTSGANGTVNFRVNGTSIGTTASIARNVSAATEFNIGSIQSGGGPVLNGDIAEVLMFEKAHSAAEIAIVENYLKNKYNL